MKTPIALVALAFVLASASPLGAVNRLFINNQVLQAGGSGQEILIRCDNDISLLGVQIALKFDRTKIRVTSVELAGAAAAAVDRVGSPTPNQLVFIDNDVRGELVYGFIGFISDPGGNVQNKAIPAGANQVIAKLTVNAIATASTSTVLDFADVTVPPLLKNVFADIDGRSLSPATVDGTITIEPFAPLIQTITGNSGLPGKGFTVVGRQFNRPGLAVTICGQAAVHQLQPDGQTLNITAPDCAAEGWSVLAICNDFGCDSRAQGFNYLPPPAPEIISLLENTGLAGKVFTVIGRNYDQPGLTVKVCDTTAVFTMLNGQTLNVTAPPCAIEACVPIEICNDFGCVNRPTGFCYDKVPVGTPFTRGDANADDIVDISDAVTILGDLFLGDPAPARCRDALDANDDGQADISDAVTVLGHLFLGDGPLPPPFPGAGLDPTLDSLPTC